MGPAEQKDLAYNHKLLAIEIISKSLDDICPRFVDLTKKFDPITTMAVEAVRKTCGQIHLGQVLITKQSFDAAWDKIVREYNTKISILRAERDASISSIANADNSHTIDLKLDKAEMAWDKRQKSLGRRLRARRRAFDVKVTEQIGTKYTTEEADDLRAGLESSLNREIREFEKRREAAINKIRQARNSERIIERLMEKRVLYDLRRSRLDNGFARQETIYNRKWDEEDVFGAALHWFIYDIDRVNFWCIIAGIPLRLCYEGVADRLKQIEYDAPEIQTILRKIKTGQISELTIPQISVTLKEIL